MTICAAAVAAVCMQAQKIKTVDMDGNAVPLVSVLTEEGNMIGVTDMNGELSDVKGASRIAVTHVAYKPQIVTVKDLNDVRIVMQDVGYGLDEVVITPKPYLYAEYYYRAFRYVGDSLRAYSAGIVPAAFETNKNLKPHVRSVWSSGTFANKATTWHNVVLEGRVTDWIKNSSHERADVWLTNDKVKEKYRATIKPDGQNRWIVQIPTKTVGQIVNSNGLSRTTLDAGTMQIYSNEVHGEKKMQKVREKRNYEYQYAEVHRLGEASDEEAGILDHVMTMHHWEYDDSKGRETDIIYIYTTDHGYTDQATFKARSKELNKGHAGDMTLAELQEYERSHNVPELSPAQLKAIQALRKGQGKEAKEEKRKQKAK